MLKPCYQIVHKSPARGNDYIPITKSTKFPPAFCSLWWLENKAVADRFGQRLWKLLNTGTLPKSKQPKCKSFKIVSKAVNYVLTPLKLSFLSYMASLFHPFLKTYQRELPLISFMYDDLTKVLKKFLKQLFKMKNEIVVGKIFPK